MRPACLVAVSLVLWCQGSAAQEKKAEDLKKLQGKWLPLSQEWDDKLQERKAWIHQEWQFDGNEVKITTAGVGGGAESTLTFSLEIDPGQTPANMDMKAKNPKLGFIAIYKFDGDKLVVCWNAGRETRPSKFEATKKDTYTLITLVRGK